MKTIAIFSTTRAEFGILSALMKEIDKSSDIKYLLFAGGSHLAYETGHTVAEILNQNFPVTATFDYQLNQSDSATIAKSLGLCTMEVASIFKNFEFDLVCILGDRMELLSIVSVAIVFNKPIIHLHGGERTEGAIDEQIRHMVTKASHLHFASCSEYASNIIHMGEDPSRVHNVGALAVDNMVNLPKIPKEVLFQDLGMDLNIPVVLMTYHPVTLENNISPLDQIVNIFNALGNYKFQILVTSPNADKDRDVIFEFIQKHVHENNNLKYIESLGVKRYLNLIPFCQFVIGNSSSAIIEVPFFKVPVVNIGDRQKGRIMHENIISCGYSVENIKDAIDRAINPKFYEEYRFMSYKFGDGKAASRIVNIIRQITDINGLLVKRLIFT